MDVQGKECGRWRLFQEAALEPNPRSQPVCLPKSQLCSDLALIELAVARFFNTEFMQLGAELHAASYAIKMGGKARFNADQEWIGKLEQLPKPNDSFSLDGLDLSKTVVNLNGLCNLGKQKILDQRSSEQGD